MVNTLVAVVFFRLLKFVGFGDMLILGIIALTLGSIKWLLNILTNIES